MKEQGLRSHVALRKPCITERLAALRLDFARNLSGLPDEAYNSFLFCDEGRINCFGNDVTRLWVKRRRNQSLLPGAVRRSTKFRGGGVGVSFWACVSSFGAAPLVFYNQRMNGEFYEGLLRRELRASAEFLGMENFTVVEDPASFHKCEQVRRFYQEEDIPFIHIPGNSPDVNIIEAVFCILKKKVFGYQDRYRRIPELKRAILRAWEEIQQERQILLNLITPYRNRLTKIINNNGYNSKY